MKYFLVLPLLLLTLSAQAQVKLGFVLKPDVALQYERVGAEITIQNNTGKPLDSSSNGNCRISYIVRFGKDTPMAGLENVEALPVLVPPARTLTFADDISKRFNLGKMGPYTVQLKLEWSDYVFTSESRFVDVVSGTEVDHLTTSTPDGERTFSLRLLNREKHDRLFLRIEDPSVCYGVFDLGRVVRMSNPEIKMDAKGMVHILHQSGPQQYSYVVYSPQGVRTRKETYGDNITRATIVSDDVGAVSVETVHVATQNEIKPLEALPLDKTRARR